MSCLFDSLSQGLYFLTEKRIDVRQYIVSYMVNNINTLANGMKIQDWLTMAAKEIGHMETWEEYINYMSKKNTWGGGPEIAIFSKMFKIKVDVNCKDKKLVEFLLVDNPIATITLYWSGNHYTFVSAHTN